MTVTTPSCSGPMKMSQESIFIFACVGNTNLRWEGWDCDQRKGGFLICSFYRLDITCHVSRIFVSNSEFSSVRMYFYYEFLICLNELFSVIKMLNTFMFQVFTEPVVNRGAWVA